MGPVHAAAGLQISASVRLTRPFGAGGMGSVWLADHLTLGTQVIVKFMSAAVAADPRSRERFSREAVAASQVKSPHVVQTFDHGVTPDGVPYIVMELLEGEDLAHRLRRGPLSLRETAAVVTQVCRALSRAHERGVVHRDIKPDNIFLCDLGGDEPFVKILDFGIAKSAQNPTLGSTTQTGAMLGTPYYMSPEQFAGSKSIDHRTDLWSLGIVAFECLTGERPFNADTIGALAIAVYSTPIPCIQRPGLPPAVDAWLARACARDAAVRFATAKELGDALAAIAGPETRTNIPVERHASTAPGDHASPMRPALLVTTGGASTLTTAPGPAPRRSRGAIAALAGLAVALVLGGVIAVSAGGRTSGNSQAAASASAEEPMVVEQRTIEPAVVAAQPSASSAEIARMAPSASVDGMDSSAPSASMVASADTRFARAKVPVPRASMPQVTASAPAPKSPPPPSKGVDCNPNFYLDAHGDKRWKPQCF